jgi:hypothetical protein
MASIINASTSGVGGVITTADNSGDLNIQSGGSTKIAVTSAGAAITGALTVNGTAIAPSKILQVVNASSTSTATTTSASYVDSGLCTASITTTAANSKLLVIQTFAPEVLISASAGAVIATRSSLDSYGSNLAQTAINYASGYGVQTNSTLQVLHNPLQGSGTTITYKLYWFRNFGSNTQYIGDGWTVNPTNTITILEVAA